MDLAKFLSLLDRSALYFPRVDQLAITDPFEGYYTNANARAADLKYEQVPKQLLDANNIKDEQTFNLVVGGLRMMRQLQSIHREVMYVNSWHVLEHESAAMWTLYLRSQDGIAVRSTYPRLVDSLSDYHEFPIFIGKIRYIDYEREIIPWGQVLFPAMHKRKSFEHEQELRALIWTLVEPKHNFDFNNPKANPFHDVMGLYVDVDLDKLIDQVYVAPTAPKWLVDLLTTLMKKYGFNKDVVVHSSLASLPLV